MAAGPARRVLSPSSPPAAERGWAVVDGRRCGTPLGLPHGHGRSAFAEGRVVRPGLPTSRPNGRLRCSWRAVDAVIQSLGCRRSTLLIRWGPDACGPDPSAPCAYWHLKLHAPNGGRTKLSQRDLEFVAWTPGRSSRRAGARRRGCFWTIPRGLRAIGGGLGGVARDHGGRPGAARVPGLTAAGLASSAKRTHSDQRIRWGIARHGTAGARIAAIRAPRRRARPQLSFPDRSGEAG
jgi:hypothetical protein